MHVLRACNTIKICLKLLCLLVLGYCFALDLTSTENISYQFDYDSVNTAAHSVRVQAGAVRWPVKWYSWGHARVCSKLCISTVWVVACCSNWALGSNMNFQPPVWFFRSDVHHQRSQLPPLKTSIYFSPSFKRFLSLCFPQPASFSPCSHSSTSVILSFVAYLWRWQMLQPHVSCNVQ